LAEFRHRVKQIQQAQGNEPKGLIGYLGSEFRSVLYDWSFDGNKRLVESVASQSVASRANVVKAGV